MQWDNLPHLRQFNEVTMAANSYLILLGFASYVTR
ncbi:hypothetical protein Y017_15025 [Alcanivorax sp. 97CO-5]|jgi:hypothetical protein|nr:hypothetical protein Y017_15025 [Alcanivorax sp. 97CO-5]